MTPPSPCSLLFERCIGDKKPMIYVSKRTKDQRRQKTRDGIINPGRNVEVIDDVIAKGGSTTTAIIAIRPEGGEVEDTIFLIDRLDGGRIGNRFDNVQATSRSSEGKREKEGWID